MSNYGKKHAKNGSRYHGEYRSGQDAWPGDTAVSSGTTYLLTSEGKWVEVRRNLAVSKVA